MKYLMLGGAAATAVAGACGSASAQPAAGAAVRWSPVSEDYRAEYFYDPRGVERLGGMIRFRMRFLMRPGRDRVVRSAIAQVEINCAEQATSHLGFELYGEGGALLESRSQSEIGPDVRRIRSGSPEEVLYRRLCPASLVRPIPVPPPPPPFVTVTPPRAPLTSPMPPFPPPLPLPSNHSQPAVRAQWMTPLATLISEDDYPAAALRTHAQGTVRASLRVSRQGRVTACTITASSGSSVLDAATCRILTARAGFTPARDSRGRTVTDTAAAGVRWVIPVDPEPEPAEGPPQPPGEQS